MADVAPMSEEPLSSRLFQAASLVCISVPEYNYEPDFPWGFLDPDKRLELCEALVLSPSRSQWAKNLQWIKGLSLLTRLLLVALPQKVLGALQNSDSRFSIPFKGFEAPTIVDLFTNPDFKLLLFIISLNQSKLVAQAAGHFDLTRIFEYVHKRGNELESIVSLNYRGLREIRQQLRRRKIWTKQHNEKRTDSSWASFLMRVAQLNLESMIVILPLLLIITAEDLADLDTVPEIPEIAPSVPNAPTISGRKWTHSKLELISITQIPEPEILRTLKDLIGSCIPNELVEELACICEDGDCDAFHLMDFYRGLFINGLRRSLPRLQMVLPCISEQETTSKSETGPTRETETPSEVETETALDSRRPFLRLSCPPGSVCKQVASFYGCRRGVECFAGDGPFNGFQLARVQNLRNLKPGRTWGKDWPEFRRFHESCHRVVSHACQLMPATEPLFTLAMLCQLRVLDLETGFWLLSAWLTDGLGAVRKAVDFGFEAALESEENFQWTCLQRNELLHILRLVNRFCGFLNNKVKDTKSHLETRPLKIARTR
eukprot:Gregarina_sp_Poly_1__10351@NODE_737_length_6531_cov_32_916770_g423_i1_p1_GENE_NODE_737_length_6531_cov_32_916770_g423_i1NODE_737_length_6531_cov_32_916770_g423_i1_p1_ORF_typecomplete_len545_score68_43NESP55/PF06390_12/13_NODE_737_length_6531_cov_32_916770_g423_i115983232